MVKRTKKVGVSGKFGTRYGMRTRKRYAEVDQKMRGTHRCPTCEKRGVKRVSTGIWMCRKCGTKFAGGAYLSSTAMAKTVDRAVKRAVEGE